jgi:heme/copper-type cytochrome/quinol oxidase subunit 4
MDGTRELGMKFYAGVWIGLIATVGVEVFLTYLHFPSRVLVFCLLCLAFFEAAIALLYFMHLKYESARLFWTLVPITIFVLFMMDHIWPDAFRLLNLRLIR